MLFTRRPPEDQRSKGAIAVSVVVHVVLAAGLLQVVLGSGRIAEWLVGPEGRTAPEKVEVIAVRPPTGNSEAGGAAVNGEVKPTAPRRVQSGPLVAPAVVPTTTPQATGGQGGAGGGTGNGYGRGAGSGVAGIVPGYDPRLYPGTPEAPPPPRLTPKERLDSVIADRFAQYEDSIANAVHTGVTEDGRANLTFKKGGRTYGWTQKGIVLGKYTLPAPLLALLPLNRIGGNPSALLRGEIPGQMRSQILAGAQVALNAETFNERVKRIRERRDRERRDARGETQPAPVPVQQPIQQPQDR